MTVRPLFPVDDNGEESDDLWEYQPAESFDATTEQGNTWSFQVLHNNLVHAELRFPPDDPAQPSRSLGLELLSPADCAAIGRQLLAAAERATNPPAPTVVRMRRHGHPGR